MNNRWNLPPGCSPRDTEWPPDIRSWHERAIDFIRENRELPDTQEVREYVMQRFAGDDEPTPNEVLAWVEGQAGEEDMNPYTDPTLAVGAVLKPVCCGCGHYPCKCVPVLHDDPASPF